MHTLAGVDVDLLDPADHRGRKTHRLLVDSRDVDLQRDPGGAVDLLRNRRLQAREDSCQQQSSAAGLALSFPTTTGRTSDGSSTVIGCDLPTLNSRTLSPFCSTL